MMNNFQIIAKTLYGLEEVLAEELKSLGAVDVEKGIRSVSFRGDLGFMYKANLSCRTALKILLPLHRFYVQNEDELYKAVMAYDWRQHLSLDKSFAVSATLHSEKFKHNQYAALKTKDAIVDQFRKHSGRRPNVNTQQPDVAIELHINDTLATLSLDSSGASLHHRGYRSATNLAPINEVLAAGMLLLSGWRGQTDFLDPMCGSGTLPIEAAMIAARIPANCNRTSFAFQKWDNYEVDLFETIFDAQMDKIINPKGKIMGFDKAPSAIEKGLENVKNARLEEFVSLKKADFFQEPKLVEGRLHMLFNPPYGQRLKADVEILYKNIGDTLKQHYTHTDAWLITSDPQAMKSVGLRPTRKIKLFNGGLEAHLLHYVIYSGSKKQKHEQNS